MSKYTPGPWTGGKDIPLRATDTEALGFSVVYINTDSAARKDVAKANARLLHAATDMHALLLELNRCGEVRQDDLLRVLAQVEGGVHADR